MSQNPATRLVLSIAAYLGTEHVLAIALQPGMQKKLLRSSVAAQRVGARFSRQPPLLELGTKRISASCPVMSP